MRRRAVATGCAHMRLASFGLARVLQILVGLGAARRTIGAAFLDARPGRGRQRIATVTVIQAVVGFVGVGAIEAPGSRTTMQRWVIAI